MRRFLHEPILLFIGLFLWNVQLKAQHEKLINYPVDRFFQEKELFKEAQHQHHYYLNAEFREMPDFEALRAAGIELLDYRGDFEFTARIPHQLSGEQLHQLGLRTLALPRLENKISSDILQENYPDWAEVSTTEIDIAVVFHPNVSEMSQSELLTQHGAEVLEGAQHTDQIKIVRVGKAQAQHLAGSPIVAYVDLKQAPVQKLNHENIVNHRANVLHASVNRGGMDLRGKGVCIGIGDGGELGEHIDLEARVINEASGTFSAYGSHGDHVAGIIAGAGNLNPRHRGISPECTIITQKTTLITYLAEEYQEKYGMVLTNNSYGVNFNCASNGSYNYTSLSLDKQLKENPKMLHVFAAGNSGSQSCDGFPAGYQTVLRYYAAAKNVLTVGAVDENRQIANLSSRGPVRDGRIKPEIVGVGLNVISTGRQNNYFSSGGTSMSAPAITGSLGLLYEGFRKENDGVDPDGGLIKAIVCNTAEDLGNQGPDYVYGYGLINVRRAQQLINKKQYQEDHIQHGESKTLQINVPEGVKQLRALLYWTDVQGQAYGVKALVNDLDLRLQTPDQGAVLPWILNADPAHVADPAVRGVDTLNNMEQITLDHPMKGTYQLKVDGSTIPMGPQKYFVVYELVYENLSFTFPLPDESIVPGTRELIQWDADDTNADPYTLKYSIDGGSNWTILAENIDPASRQYAWDVPQDLVPDAKLSISHSTLQHEVAFSILEQPESFNAQNHCEGYVQLSWDAVDLASGYEILMLQDGLMKPVETTTQNSFVFEKALPLGKKQWFAVRAITDTGKTGPCTMAEFFMPEPEGTCPWDDDISVYPEKVELVGRAHTKHSLSDVVDINVQMKNVGQNNMQGIQAYYSINNEHITRENIDSILNSGEMLQYKFEQTADLSHPGNYIIDTWLTHPGDEHNFNDSLREVVIARQLPNPPLNFPYIEDFNQVAPVRVDQNQIGFPGLEAWDFRQREMGGADIVGGSEGDNFLLIGTWDIDTIGLSEMLLTLNLSEHKLEEGLFVSFDYFAIDFSSGNQAWVRGSDDREWLPLWNLYQVDEWKKVGRINLVDILQNAGQELSSSFQLKFSQEMEGFEIFIDNLKLEMGDTIPMDLAHFEAYKTEEDNTMIHWETETEQDYDYFEVQVARGENDLQAKNFRTIGTVDAVGQSKIARSYEYTDTEPDKSGKRYYRLKQVDEDGMFRFTKAIEVDYTEEVYTEISVFPNPFVELLEMKVPSEQTEMATIQVVDFSGRVVKQFDQPLEEGGNYLQLDLGRALSPGTYLLRIIRGSEVHTQKIVNLGIKG